MTDVTGRPLADRLSELAEACRVLEMEGHGDKTLGHLSLRDPEGRGAWVKRAAISLGEVTGAQDFVLTGYDGAILSGDGVRPMEWPIHTELYRARPDIQAVAHTHAFHICVFAVADTPLEAVTREGNYLRGALAYYRRSSRPIITRELGVEIAATVGANNAIMMQNHGAAFCGRSIGECAVTGLMLERACRAQLAAAASGLEWTPSRAADQPPIASGKIPERDIIRIWNHFRRRLARYERHGAARQIFGSSRHAG